MINKLITLITCLFASSLIYGATFSSGYAITKDNKDSTVNLRCKEELRSNVLMKLAVGTPVSCSLEEAISSDFCFVKFDQNNPINTGYIHKSRLLFLDDDKSFNKIPLIESNLYSATYKNDQVIVKIKLILSKFNVKDFSWNTSNEIKTLMYNGLKVYGTDNEIIDSAFLYFTIEIKINEVKYNIPSTEFQNLFIPPYFVENNMVFDNISIYYNANDDLLYIFSNQADGAAIYTVVFEIKNNSLKQKGVWTESY